MSHSNYQLNTSYALVFTPTGEVQERGYGFTDAQQHDADTVIYCKHWKEPWCICAEYTWPQRTKEWEAMELKDVPSKFRAYALVMS